MTTPAPAAAHSTPGQGESGSTAAPRNRQRPRRNRGPPRAETGAASAGSASDGGHDATRRSRGQAGRRARVPPGLSSAEPSSHDESSNETRAAGSSARVEGSLGSRRARGAKLSHSVGNRFANGRAFGAQLTQNHALPESATPSSASGSRLQADAPAFTPGQPHSTRPPTSHKPPRARRMSKSLAPDLPTRIHEDIDNGQYECAICTNEVYRNSKVWSCRTCWTVFHLSCIKKWSTSEGATKAQQQPENGDMPPSRQWRCPGCNLPQDTLPKTFTCWCEKDLDPKSLPGLPPYSCGQSCSRDHIIPKKCPHPCNEICHAGPCPPCPNPGPTQICFCGKESRTKRCIETDYEHGWSCGSICGELLPCGEHYCDRPCHEGLCGACEAQVNVRCYCGKVEQEMSCCDKGDEEESMRESSGSSELETWTGSFECGQPCDRPFDCGKHACSKGCHPQDPQTSHCPRSPDTVDHCPCGKTPLAEMDENVRQSCEDPIPHCDKICSRTLDCGHVCQQKCHIGKCLPCMQVVDIRCRCGRTTSSTICHQGTEEPPQCLRMCRATLNCGRHQCDERCCSGERKATERQATKKKARGLDSAPRALEDGFEAEHICTRVCGRTLRCGSHSCQELCHRGPCGSCREAIFDDISCHCGRTVLQSPLPCGTKPPPCRYECERSKTCGHPQVSHNCHMDDESCPKCPFLTPKFCLCGKQQMKNQPCWLAEVRCGEVCGKSLKCGAHKCRKPCHRPGECEDAQQHCQQECGKEKSCGHPDSAACHAPQPCKEDKPCRHRMLITCSCQRSKKEVSCNASIHTRGNLDRMLDCDEECARLQRNHRLATALNIDPETHKDDHIPYSAETLNMFLGSVQWAQAQERELRLLAADPEAKRLRFKPMPAQQRAFLHALAEDFGFDSESMDPEPHRHVAIFKTPRFVAAPMKTLAECARIRHSQRLAAAAQAPAAATTAAKKVKASNVVSDPYNGYLLTNPSFGLTLEELRAAIRPALLSVDNLHFDISFLPSEEVVLKATRSTSSPQEEHALDALLASAKPSLAAAVKQHGFGSLQLCRVDASLNVLRRESDDGANGGWSQVAAKAAAPARGPVVPVVGVKNNFTVLSTGTSRKKTAAKAKTKVEKEDDPVDDWEEAERAEEEREKKAASGDEEVRGATAAVAAAVTAEEETGTAS